MLLLLTVSILQAVAYVSVAQERSLALKSITFLSLLLCNWLMETDMTPKILRVKTGNLGVRCLTHGSKATCMPGNELPNFLNTKLYFIWSRTV